MRASSVWDFIGNLPQANLDAWYRYLTIFAIGLPVLGAIMGGVCGWGAFRVSDRIGALQAAQMQNQGTAITAQKDVVDSQLQTISQQNQQITALTGELKSVRERAAELEVRAQNSERGISDTYDFNGVHRQNMGAGRVEATVGPETNEFQQMVKLQNDKNWIGLRDLCEDQIKRTPDWLTPYLASGVAYANLLDFPRAKERLEFVVTKAGNDTHYSDASRILAEIKSRTPP